METIMADLQWAPIVATIVYSFLGLAIFIVAYFIMDRLTPFSIHKEIEEDHNVALGIILGAVFIAIAIIVAAAIRG